MPDTNVIDFEQARRSLKKPYIAEADTAFRRTGTEPGSAFVVRRMEHSYPGSTALLDRIGIDTLYPATEDTQQDVTRVIALLAEAVDVLGKARDTTNPIAADRIVQQFQSMLPQLFRYRSVGD